jgi:CRP-like cAMP-binding protein
MNDRTRQEKPMTLALATALKPDASKPSIVASALASRAALVADDGLKVLAQLGNKVRFSRNETIFNEGDEAAFSYKVVSGAVRLCKHTSSGRRQIADFLLAGDFFGFLQFGNYSFTAEAVSDVVVICYPQRQVEQLTASTPSLGRKILVLLSQRLLGMQDHLVMLGRQAAKEKIASFLLLLAERAEAEDGEAFDIPMSRQDFADYLGLTVETVCRSLSELKRTKLIRIPSIHQIVVDDSDGLRAAAENDSDE